jgi:hypothetical protein
MLVGLLKLISASNGLFSLARLAEQLGSSTKSVRAMIEELARLGYLESIPMDCLSGSCGTTGCGGCAVKLSARAWMLTPKGQALVGRQSGSPV